MFRQNLKTRKIDKMDTFPKCAYYQPSIFDELLFDDCTRCSDVSFIFNQTRLDKIISKDSFDAYFSALFRDGSPNPYEGMSDDDIMSLVKDRRMTSFNDFYNYTRNLQHDASELQEYKSMLEARQKQIKDTNDKLEEMRKKLGFVADK